MGAEMESRDSGISPGASGKAIAAIAFALTALGVVMIYSASNFVGVHKFEDSAHFFKRQLIGAAIGIAAFLFCVRVPYRFWAERCRIVYLITLILLVAVLIFGSKFNGARRWLRIGGVIGCQPSEYAKLAVVIFASAFLASGRAEIRDLRRGFFPAILPIALIALLVLVEPDFGTALFLCTLGVMVLIVGGLRISHLLLAGLALGPVVTVVMVTKYDYVKERLAFFSSDGVNYQVDQAFLALGSGGLLGRGIGAGTQKLFFLPEVSGDFIFPAIAEETGFVGVLVVVLLFVAFAWFGLKVAREALCHDLFAFYLAVGIVCWISLQALINLAVVSGAAPTKGIALPFISFGSSSLIAVLMGTGVLVSISRTVDRRRRVDLLRRPV